MKERAQRLGVPERMIEGMSNGGVRIGERGEKLGPVDDPRFTLGPRGGRNPHARKQWFTSRDRRKKFGKCGANVVHGAPGRAMRGRFQPLARP